MKLIISLVAVLFSITSFAQDIEVLVDGKSMATITVDDVKKLDSEKIEFYNSVTRRSELYRGVPFKVLMDKLVPDAMKSMVEVEFKTTNEFDTFVPRELFDRTDAVLAYERADGDTFTRYSQKRRILVSVGPLYLIWNMKKVPKDDRIFFSSIYQINKINLVSNKTDFGVKEDAVDKSIYLGLQAYKRNCISCHAVGNYGGGISMDLVKQNTIETKGAEYIKKYILDPKVVNPKTQMLPMPMYKNRDELVTGIIDFLNFMKNPEGLLRKKIGNKEQSSYKALREIVDQTH